MLLSNAKNRSTIIQSLLILFSLPATAYAYLDPGSGSFIFQILIAALLGFAFTIRTYWKKISAFAKRITRSGDTDEDRS